MKILTKILFLYFLCYSFCNAVCDSDNRYELPNLIRESKNEFYLKYNYVFIRLNYNFLIKITRFKHYDKAGKNKEAVKLLAYSSRDRNMSSELGLFYPNPEGYKNSHKSFYQMKPSKFILNSLKDHYRNCEEDSLSEISFDEFKKNDGSAWIRVGKHFYILIVTPDETKDAIIIYSFYCKDNLFFHSSYFMYNPNKGRGRSTWNPFRAN